MYYNYIEIKYKGGENMAVGDLFIIEVYLAGILSFFSPCIFSLIPVYLSILSIDGKRSVIKTFLFVVGLSTSFIILGFGAGSIGQILLSDTFRIISGIIVILFGIIQMELITIPFLQKTKLLEIKKAEGTMLEAYLIGFSFSLG